MRTNDLSVLYLSVGENNIGNRKFHVCRVDPKLCDLDSLSFFLFISHVIGRPNSGCAGEDAHRDRGGEETGDRCGKSEPSGSGQPKGGDFGWRPHDAGCDVLLPGDWGGGGGAATQGGGGGAHSCLSLQQVTVAILIIIPSCR